MSAPIPPRGAPAAPGVAPHAEPAARPLVAGHAATAAVWLEALTVRYGERGALDDISLAVAPGERFALLGPNGSGKSTLLRVLSTLLRPSAGRALLTGLDVVRESAAVRHRLGVVFQAPGLDGKLTVAENLRFQGHLFGLHGRALAERSEALLGRFGLLERRRDRAETLSGGLRRRVELARALLHRPAVLLLDEPTAGLDLASQQEFWRILAELQGEGPLTVVVATHLMDEAERCGRVALLDQGRLVALDAPAALKHALGESVLTLESGDPRALAQRLGERLGLRCVAEDGRVRVLDPADGELASRLLAQYPDSITALRLGRPTLGDVFLARTGRSIGAAPAVPPEAP